MSEKLDTEEWSKTEMIASFASTPAELHSILVGFVNGISLGRIYKPPVNFIDEEHYYALGWSIGQFIEEILIRLSPKTSSTDTKVGIGQIGGVVTLISSMIIIINIIL